VGLRYYALPQAAALPGSPGSKGNAALTLSHPVGFSEPSGVNAKLAAEALPCGQVLSRASPMSWLQVAISGLRSLWTLFDPRQPFSPASTSCLPTTEVYGETASKMLAVFSVPW
jgi:hypothetical protein